MTGKRAVIDPAPQRHPLLGIDGVSLVILALPPLFWAGNAVAGRLAAGRIGPLELNCLRWLGATLVLTPFAWRACVLHRGEIRARWRILVLLAIFGVGCFNSLQYWALKTSTPTNTTLIGSAGPVFVLSIGALFFGERVRAREFAGAVLSVAGVFWVMLRGDWSRLQGVQFERGDCYMLLATLTWSIYTWLLRKHRPALPLRALLWMQMFIGLAILAPLALIEAHFRQEELVWSADAFVLLAYVALFPSLLAYYCYDRSVARVGAQLPVFFNNLTPVFAAVISMPLLREYPQSFHVIGLILILSGIRLLGSAAR
ncbi:MAG: DMT family transporter [Burkholderiaceae bacterium]|jgi:drug/metabolite transporter (DMT)-like permease